MLELEQSLLEKLMKFMLNNKPQHSQVVVVAVVEIDERNKDKHKHQLQDTQSQQYPETLVKMVR